MSEAPVRLVRDGEKRGALRIRFTKKTIEGLQATGRRRAVYDDKTPGLSLQVTERGHKAFYFTGRVNGRHRKARLGDFPGMTIEQARRAADWWRGEIAAGRDPFERRREQREQQAHVRTFKGAWEHYRDYHLKPNCAPRAARNDSYLFEAVTFKTRRLDGITTADVKRLHEKIAQRGAESMANKTVRFVRRIFNHAIDELGHTGNNPARLRQGRRRQRASGRRGSAAVSLAQERSRERYIEPLEMPAFLRALDAEPDADFADFIRLMLFTGARRGNVQAMRWGDVNLGRATWTIPADAAKAGESITVPLSSHALTLLKRRRGKAAEGAVYVFPSSRAASGHMTEPKKKWWALRERAGTPDVTLHDLRRTVGSWATNQGVAYPVVKAMLGHAGGGDVTAIYSRVDVETVRNAFERTTRGMLQYQNIGASIAHVKQ